MQTEVELKAAQRRLHEEVKKTLADETMTPAAKSEVLDKIEVETKDLAVDMANRKRFSALMHGDDQTPVETKAYEPRSLGEAITMNDAYMEAKKATDPNSRFTFRKGFEIGTKAQGAPLLMGENVSGTTAPAPLSGQFLGGTAGTTIMPNYLPGIVEQRFYPLTILDLIPAGTTESPVITYVRETSWTNNAAPVAEGATKPYSALTVTRFQETIGKIAHLHKITDEMVQDAPQFRSFLENRLVRGVSREEEVQVLAGGGIPGVSGILNRTTSFTAAPGFTPVVAAGVAFPTVGTAGEGAGSATVASISYGRQTGTATTVLSGVQMAEGIYGSLTDIRVLAFCEPDAIVMNPRDWMTLRLAKDAQGQYLGGSFFGTDYGQAQNAGASLWGLRVVATPAMPIGTCLVGSFQDAAQLFRRQGITVDMSNSNGTDFEQNLITVRAESRLGLVVYRPEAFQLLQFLHS